MRCWEHRLSLSTLTITVALAMVLTRQMATAGTGQEPPEPIASSTSASTPITLTGDGRYLLATNPESHTVSIIDTVTRSVVAEVPVGLTPRSVALSGDDKLAYVANQGSDSFTVMTVPAGKVLAQLAVGRRPAGIAVSPDDRLLVISEMGDDTVRFVNRVTLNTVLRWPVPDRPYGLAFTPDGAHLLISHLLDGAVTVLAAQPYRQALPLMANGGTESLADVTYITREITVPETGPTYPASTGIAGDQTNIPTWSRVAPAPAVVINGTGDRAYLPQTMGNALGLNTSFDTTLFPRVSVLDLDTWTHETTELISLPENDRPVGLPWAAAVARNDQELWVVNAASNDLSVVDISLPTAPQPRAHVDLGSNPRGLVIDAVGGSAYVTNALQGTVTVVDTTTYSVTAVITTTHLPLPPTLLLGKQLFYSSARPDLSLGKWISCNSCHVEGEHDGRTWRLPFLGQVPPGATPVITRNTTTLLGMVETYPLRWSAEWDEAADSEFSIRFEQFGAGLIAGPMHPPLGEPNQGRSDELDALAAYLDSLPALSRQKDLSAAALRGQEIFHSPDTQCAVCHPPPLYSDLQPHDVGTATGSGEWLGPIIDTPVLRFLQDSSPYLHDGSAETLYSLLTTRNLEDKHGVTSPLTDLELADLVAFLLALPFE